MDKINITSAEYINDSLGQRTCIKIVLDEEEIIVDDEEEFKESECQCAMCNCMNTIYTRWEGFTPQTSIEKAMFNHINSI